MKTQKFKTNAKCGGCTAKIDTELSKILPSGTWSFDLSSPDKVLSVKTDIPSGDIVKAVENAGYKAAVLTE